MFKQIMRGVSKFLTKEKILALIILIVLAWGLFTYSGSKMKIFDKMSVGTADAQPAAPAQQSAPAPVKSAEAKGPGAGYALQPVANPSDLLPKDENSQWSALNPNAMNKGDVMMPDLLQAGYHIGLDTIGQSLRNANLQLRSDPIISKSDIGPWNQSTIEPDFGRTPLEIGR
jgi:hypothetical protein